MLRSMMLAATLIVTLAVTAAAQDAGKGEHNFAVCQTCHAIGPDAANMLGPELNGLDGRHCGTAPGYPYSEANKDSGIVWSEATFKQYIRDPQKMVPGTKMYFAGIKDPQQINDLWAYVSQFDADGAIKKK
jgi:cytochrome c